MGSLSEDLLEEEGSVSCFRVKYLGCAAFSLRKKRLPKGISAMQRPLLDVYASARKKGHAGAHLFPATQRLEVLDYGLVVAEGGTAGKNGPGGDLVLVKVLTPLSNAVLWAAVRFQARALRKRVLGAAFVPLACCDSVFEQKGYLRLDAKYRFLVSLSHPSVFSVVFRRVTDPKSFECHAFACGSARDALALGSAMSQARERCDMPIHASRLPPPSATPPWPADDRRRANFQRRKTKLARIKQFPDSDESNSYASVHKPRLQKNPHQRRRRAQSSESSLAKLCQREAPIGAAEVYSRWTPNSAPSSSVSFFSPSDDSCSGEYHRHHHHLQAKGPAATTQKDVWTMTEKEVGELEETIDLSSENSSFCGGVQRRPLADQSTNGTGSSAPVKYTYFGYETFRAPTWNRRVCVSDDDVVATMGTAKPPDPRRPSSSKGANIVGNGTSRITINVPFSKKRQHRRSGGGRSSAASTQTDASSFCSAAVLLPVRGVRSFRSDRQVADWSTLSQSTSDEASVLQSFSRKPRHCASSLSSSSGSNRHCPRSAQPQKPPKMLRWSSEHPLPTRNGYTFFWSLKKLSLRSLTKAKHKTGKLFSNMRTKLMGTRKCPDGSEDSAYDTSEVCLSPSGRATCRRSCCAEPAGLKARRQQSWSFHDLRSVEDRSPTRTTPVVLVSTLPDKSPAKRRASRRRPRERLSSASDSGVEEYPSDGSGVPGSDRTCSNRRVTRVQVHHGMNDETFQRWSRTNLQDELGYIP